MSAQESTSVENQTIDSVLRSSRALLALAIRSLTVIDVDLSLVQYRSLVYVAQHPNCTVGELAESLGVAHPTVTRLCDRLIVKGLLLRKHSEKDRRRVELLVSEKAVDALATVTRNRKAEIARVLAKIPKTKWEEVVNALDLISEATSETKERTWY